MRHADLESARMAAAWAPRVEAEIIVRLVNEIERLHCVMAAIEGTLRSSGNERLADAMDEHRCGC